MNGRGKQPGGFGVDTEAAAATSSNMVESEPYVMRVDRPFVFVIRDSHSQTILFIGKIVEPTLE